MQPIKTLQDIIELKKLYKNSELSSITVSKPTFDNLLKEINKNNKVNIFELPMLHVDNFFKDDYAIAKFIYSKQCENISEKYIETSDEDFEKSWQMVQKDKEKGLNASS
jgi:hypothetical protein